MSRRDSRRGRGDKNARRTPSVVGSTLREISNNVRGRGLPPGGIRESDGLKVAEGALPDSTIMRIPAGEEAGGHILRLIAIVSGSLAGLLLLVVLTITIVSRTSAFTIANIATGNTEHVSAEDVARLVEVPAGATLLNIDTASVEKSVKRNPWVMSVDVERVFPDTLSIGVHERTLSALVSMGSGGVAWLLSTDNNWIEPMHIEAGEGESFNDAALRRAGELGVILISDVPATVTPVAGTQSTDASIAAVKAFREQLSDDFQRDIVGFSAAGEDDISCVLANGVEVSLGSASNVQTKESVTRRILGEYTGQVTYINVRVPSHPTYRRVNSTYVREGTGAMGIATDKNSTFGTPVASDQLEQPTDEQSGQTTEEEVADSAGSEYDLGYETEYQDYEAWEYVE